MTSPSREPSYRNQIDKAPIGIFEVDEHGEYVDVNQSACEMLGYSRDEFHDMTIADLTPSHDDPKEIASFREVTETGEMRTEGTLLHKEGHEVDVLIEAVALENNRFVAYVQDISEQKQYEELLKNQRDNLEILNQVLRHDIRNDLQLITSYTELLARKCENEEEKEYIGKISASADHAVELTQTAREIADVMLSVTTEKEQVNLRTILEKEISEVQEAHSDAALTYGTPIPPVFIHASDMISSVFRNLLKNAIQHNDKPVAEVTVSATEEDDTVTVRIADNGPGISDKQKDAVFGKGERDLESVGTGIGLYLVDSLVTSYNGSVWVEDNDPDGSVFVVELPKAD